MTDIAAAAAAAAVEATGAEQGPPKLGDILVARLERLPFSRKHWLVAAVLCTATFFDGYDNLMITSAMPSKLPRSTIPRSSVSPNYAVGFKRRASRKPTR